MWSPENTKDLQKLIGRLKALSRFVPKLAEKTKPIFQLLRKATKFNWIPECEEFFLRLKWFHATPPVIQKLDTERPINRFNQLNRILLQFSQNQPIENTKQSVELAWQQGQPISSFFKSFSKYSKCKTTGWVEISVG